MLFRTLCHVSRNKPLESSWPYCSAECLIKDIPKRHDDDDELHLPPNFPSMCENRRKEIEAWAEMVAQCTRFTKDSKRDYIFPFRIIKQRYAPCFTCLSLKMFRLRFTGLYRRLCPGYACLLYRTGLERCGPKTWTQHLHCVLQGLLSACYQNVNSEHLRSYIIIWWKYGARKTIAMKTLEGTLSLLSSSSPFACDERTCVFY